MGRNTVRVETRVGYVHARSIGRSADLIDHRTVVPVISIHHAQAGHSMHSPCMDLIFILNFTIRRMTQTHHTKLDLENISKEKLYLEKKILLRKIDY